MGLSTWINRLFGREEAEETEVKTEAVQPVQKVSLPMTDEEKELVAVLASCIAGKEKPDANLHISRITRID